MSIPADELAPFSATDDAIVLAAVSSSVERGLLDKWLFGQRDRTPSVQVEVLELPGGDPSPDTVAQLDALLTRDGDRLVVPARVFWMPERGLSNRSKLVRLLAGRDPYRPSKRVQRKVLAAAPSRARVVAGEPATISQLHRQWREITVADHPHDFARFVMRRATLAIERVEYRLLGPEYKSPRLVKPEMLASARFRAGLQKIPGATVEAAGKMLDEMATGWSRFSVDLIPTLGRFLFSRGFDPNIDYDLDQVEAMRRGLERFPAVTLFSHRSNLDLAVVTVAMQENRMPRAHTFGGINMSFGLMGPLMRRSGVIFIRRNIGDSALYKYVLKEYIGYLVEKRFVLSWAIEGTRSRTGKMLPPKLGLLKYVADAYLEGRSEDVLLQPGSISFDQLHETAEYAAYARGATKKPEGMAWLYDFVKAQGERSYGKIYVRFPEAVSMREYLGDPHGPLANDEAAKRLALQKMAIEVSWRILRATPVSATGLVSALLLATRGTALTLDQAHRALQYALDYLELKKTPMTKSALRLREPHGVRAALDALSDDHPVTRVDGLHQPVWRIAPDHEHEAAFYRNSIIHAFLEAAIIQLGLIHAARAECDRLNAFWAQTMRLRDLLKFDFYFADSESFRDHISEELAWHDHWEQRLDGDDDGLNELVKHQRPLMVAAMLRPYFEAYDIVAEVLVDAPAKTTGDELSSLALKLGAQYVAQGRVQSNESVSTLLFATAYQVVADQKLLDSTADLTQRRDAFAAEMRTVLDDIQTLEQMAALGFHGRKQR